MADISKRAQDFINYEFLMERYFKDVAKNPYNAENNPSGIIDMGSSTNRIVDDVIMEKLKKVELGDMPLEYFDTCETQGPLRFRKFAANFLNRQLAPQANIEPDDIFALAGAGGCFEALGFALFDKNDVILLPRPYYYQFDHEFDRVVGARLVTFPICTENVQPGLTRCYLKSEDLELVYKDTMETGGVVKSLLLVNPNNPMGYIFDSETIKLCIEFCNKYKLHLVCDEIYMKCVYGEPKFQSILSVTSAYQCLENIHVIWGFAKDFAIAGFRIGILVTKNKRVKNVIDEDLNQRVSNLTLYILEALIKDFDWLDKVYYPTFKERLQKKSEKIKVQLESYGLKCFKSNAGLFLWVDFQKYLKPMTFESEIKLFELFMKNGIYISPGKAFKEQQPGFFRVITSLSDDRIENGLGRIKEVLNDLTNTVEDG